MPVPIDAECLTAIIAAQQGNALQAARRFPKEWNNGVAGV
jgi:hypothetical protein